MNALSELECLLKYAVVILPLVKTAYFINKAGAIEFAMEYPKSQWKIITLRNER